MISCMRATSARVAIASRAPLSFCAVEATKIRASEPLARPNITKEDAQKDALDAGKKVYIRAGSEDRRSGGPEP